MSTAEAIARTIADLEASLAAMDRRRAETVSAIATLRELAGQSPPAAARAAATPRGDLPAGLAALAGDGVGPALLGHLAASGLTTVDAVRDATDDVLLAVPRVSKATLPKIRAAVARAAAAPATAASATPATDGVLLADQAGISPKLRAWADGQGIRTLKHLATCTRREVAIGSRLPSAILDTATKILRAAGLDWKRA